MKEKLTSFIEKALVELTADGVLPEGPRPEVALTIPKQAEHGDYATNVAMAIAKGSKRNPRETAKAILDKLGDAGGLVVRAEIAGPGFLNFFLKKQNLFDVLGAIEKQGDKFGHLEDGHGKKVLVEFVSANPTGPLHVGHGRGAVTGDALSSVLSAAGFQVEREYYINDAGVQIQTLGRSTWLRYRQLIEGKIDPLPEGFYQGDYIIDHAKDLRAQRGDGLTEADIPEISQWTGSRIMQEIIDDMAGLGVRFEHYFSETSLHKRGVVEAKLDDLRARGLAYDQDGALWFASTRFGDDKDRVLIKSSGEKTYLAADVAYHAEKLDRGYDELIDIWGADHHGYVPRMKAAVQALGRSPETLTCMLIQMVSLLRSGERVRMTTRGGEFVTLKELTGEVGKDATRFFFLLRRYDSHLDFDIDLAKEQSNKNPVYYVQYMHARICSIFGKAAEAGVAVPEFADIDASKLTEAEESAIAQHLAEFPPIVRRSAQAREPHRLTAYLNELAGMFHPYYFKYRIIGEDRATSAARLHLCKCVRQVTRNALTILGISSPESM
jgi:arginyl-tRNA synthetase